MLKNKLKELRKERNISVAMLCIVLNFQTAATYYKKENGTLKFSLEEGIKLSDFYDIDIKEIFFEN